MVNESNIHVKGTEKLTVLMDKIKEQTDRVDSALRSFDEKGAAFTTEQAETRQILQDQKDLLDNVNARLDRLDAELPKGSKVYQANDGVSAQDKTRQRLGEMLVDVFRAERGLPEKFGFMTALKNEARAAQSEGPADKSSADLGGYLVPEEQSNEIIRVVTNFGFARKYCRQLPMNRQVMRLPMSTFGPTVLVADTFGFTAGSAPSSMENQTGTAGSATFSRPELIAARLLAYDDISMEVIEDSSPDLMLFLVDVFGEAVALVEDYQVLSASVQPFTGVLSEADVLVPKVTLGSGGTGSYSFSQITYNNIVDTYNACDEKVQENGIWVMSTFGFNQLMKLADSTGRPLFLHENPLTEKMPMRLLGRPVVLSTKMPKAAQQTASKPLIAYGDFSRFSIFATRKAFTVETSPAPGFKAGYVTMRVMERFATKVISQTACPTFSVLKASA